MLLTPRTFTVGFATGSRHFYQTACNEGLIVQKFGDPGTGYSLLLGKMPTVFHGSLLIF
jgi:hypothetical protein